MTDTPTSPANPGTPNNSRDRTSLTRVVVVPTGGGAPSEFWAHEFDISYQDGGRTLKLLATGTPDEADQARAKRTQALGRELGSDQN